MRYSERHTEAHRKTTFTCSNIYMQHVFCGILDTCANGGIHVRGCSQSLRVRQFFGNVEGSGSPINLRGGEKGEMNAQH